MPEVSKPTGPSSSARRDDHNTSMCLAATIHANHPDIAPFHARTQHAQQRKVQGWSPADPETPCASNAARGYPTPCAHAIDWRSGRREAVEPMKPDAAGYHTRSNAMDHTQHVTCPALPYQRGLAPNQDPCESIRVRIDRVSM